MSIVPTLTIREQLDQEFIKWQIEHVPHPTTDESCVKSLYSEAEYIELSEILERRFHQLALLWQVKDQNLKIAYQAELKKIRTDANEPREIGVTISPKNDTLKECQRVIEVLRGAKFNWTPRKYVIEQRSNMSEVGYRGFHLHLSGITKEPYLADIRYKTKQALKGKKAKLGEMNVDVKFCFNLDYQDHYMMGMKGKNELEKLDKVEKDKLMRAEFGIQDIYEFNI